MRRRNVKNAHERVLNAEGLMVLNPCDYKGKWKTLFKNNNPIYLEIGMGKGKFIAEHARRNPDINYIGIEKYESVIVMAVDKVKNEELKNLHFICGDAEMLLDMFDENEVDLIYLNFSDPWPKTRHEKRRLTSSRFLSKYQVISKKEIEFKTDNRPLFEYSLISFNQNNYDFLEVSLNLHEDNIDVITTEYEDKFSAKGQPIYYVKVKHRGVN